MKKTIISILIFIGLNTVNAQISGFIGKKFSFIYSPGIGVPHISNLNERKISAIPTFHNSVKIEYIVKHRLSLGLRYKFAFNSALNKPRDNNYNGFEERHKFKSHTYGLYVKLYPSEARAPLGRYFAFSLNFQHLFLNDLVLEEFPSNIVTKENIKGFDVSFGIALGKNWIVSNRLLLGFESELNLPLHSLRKMTGYDINRSPYEPQNGPGNNYIINKFNFTSEIFKLSMNIGFLAF